MKNWNLPIVLGAIAVTLSSCKDEEQKMADEKVEQFKVFVDSISDIAMDKATVNWVNIQNEYEHSKNEAKQTLAKLDNKVNLDSILKKADSKYEIFKAKVIAKRDIMLRENFRNSLFTEKVGEDMKFEWVNKSNIVAVYEHFVATVDQNKSVYSREDWDEIKLIYEALDSRKNAVEKEGITTKDNIKIAGLKIKFTTIYQINRATAKSRENATAKN